MKLLRISRWKQWTIKVGAWPSEQSLYGLYSHEADPERAGGSAPGGPSEIWTV